MAIHQIGSALPHPVKKAWRFIRYPEERERFFREIAIKRSQDEQISSYDTNAESLIVFLVPGADRKTGKDTISGGVMSLVSLCEESKKLKAIHRAEVIMTVFPREFLFLKHENFENNTVVFRFEQLKSYFLNLKKILIHIPDLYAEWFTKSLSGQERDWLSGIAEVHVNIINANILLMPEPVEIRKLKDIAGKITITAAHTKYCTRHFRDLYGYPLHKFSAWVSPEQYVKVRYAQKKNLIAISPDAHPMKDLIVERLSMLKDYELLEMKGFSYEAFKKIVGEAKFSITFGEGLDGYILEPVFSGTIGFAAYNEDFFTEDFKDAPGIYKDYDDMLARINNDIRRLDDAPVYTPVAEAQYQLCAKHYSFAEYLENLKKFYRGEYTFQ